MGDVRVGLEEYANAIFLVHDGNGGGMQVFEDPADAIAEAEELAAAEETTWYVTSVERCDDCHTHIARPKKKRRATRSPTKGKHE